MKKNLPLLRNFLALFSSQQRVAFEFRHTSWFDEEVYRLLHDHHAALCIAEAEGKLEVPFVATTNWGYLRLRRPDYSEAELEAWVKRVLEQERESVFVFFKHEEEGRAPQFAKLFLELAGKNSIHR